MTDSNSSTPQAIPPLPQPPKRDVWGRDLPLPNGQIDWLSPVTHAQPQGGAQANVEQAVDDNTEAVKHLTDENKEIFTDIVDQFEKYVDNIKKSNQNFFLKQGKLLTTEFRKSVIEGMVEGAEKTGERSKLEDVNYNLRVVYNNLDKLIASQNEEVKIAKDNQEEDKKEKAKKKAQATAEKEDKKEAQFGWLKQLVLGKTGAERRKEEKDKRDNKRSGGLLDFGGGLLGMLGDFLLKAAPLAGLAIGLLGPEGTIHMVKIMTPAIIKLADIFEKNVIEPGIKIAAQLTKDLVIDPALKRLDIKQEDFDKAVYGDKKAKPGDFNSPYEKDGSFNPFDPKHGLKVMRDVVKYFFPNIQPKVDLSPSGLKASREQQKEQLQGWFHHHKTVANASGSPDERDEKRIAKEPVITPNVYHPAPKERDDFVSSPRDAAELATMQIMRKLENQDRERIKNSNYINDFIDQQKNMKASVGPLGANDISPEQQKANTEQAMAKVNADMTATWKSGVDKFFGGLAQAFSSDGGLMTPIGKLAQPQPTNDFQNMLSDMDKFSKVTGTMKAQSKADATKATQPIIVQAPTSINTSSSVTNGTQINTSVRAGNDRSLLGYR
jgi:hypothetical protein